MSDSTETLIDFAESGATSRNLRNGELRYRALFDLVPVAVYSTDADGVIQESTCPLSQS